MLLENFRFFAMHYLNDWCTDDSRFCADVMRDNDPVRRRDGLWEAAKYYKVTRTLPTLDGEERLAAALAAIDAVPLPVTDATVDAAVRDLASRFEELYGRYAVSAASKFLWLVHRWPVVILDERAGKCLRSSGCRFAKGDYAAYRREWRKQFTEREQVIRDACANLQRVNDFSLASWMPDANFVELTSAKWFHERVFDKFLWWNGG
jgi:hypothetical protein